MRLIRRLAYLFRFRRNGAELREELEFHRNLHEQAGLARGLSSADARDAARRAMGNETFMREEARSVWLRPWLEAVWANTAYALRGLRRNPVFALGITLTLTLGIGANAAMFSLIDRLLFRPPALMANPGSVHRAFLLKTVRGAERAQFLSYATYADISRWATGFSQLAAFSSQQLRLTVGGMSRTMPVGAVSAGFFRFFDAPPRLGRYFTEAEDSPPEGAFESHSAQTPTTLVQPGQLVDIGGYRALAIDRYRPGTYLTQRSGNMDNIHLECAAPLDSASWPMPWIETCAVDERMRFIRGALRDHLTVSELCARYGVSRRIGYK